MKRPIRVVRGLLLAVFLGWPCTAALAHSVHVFAFVDGAEIQVECGFGKKRRVRHGQLVVSDATTGAVLLRGVTNEKGVFRFRPTDEFLAGGHGLNIQLQAGEGHRDDWKMSADELRALSPSTHTPPSRQTSMPVAEPAVDGAAVTGAANDPADAEVVVVRAAELEALIARVLDAKLSPINRAVARQAERGPELRDIVGGIGWIIGLLGMATLVKYRRLDRHAR